ncbi:NAD(P)H-dependent oxidoreductase [Novosphingobium naphthalenivorans]|nr:NAD(P)H-dependent oxidoreductase [Novosphingobium naphthalenivorans]
MHILFVYAHPEPKSFTAALLEEAKAVLTEDGHSFEVSDLYGERFNPVLDRHDFSTVADEDYFSVQGEQSLAEERDGYSDEIRREQARVAKADVIVFLFPLWWGGPPAIVKGWFERVMSYGFGYVDGARYDRGLFKGRSALVCVPTGGTIERFSEGGTYGTIRQVLWPFQHCALKYTGLNILDDFIAYASPRVDQEQRVRYLAQWRDHLRAQLAQANKVHDPREIRRGAISTRPLQFDPHVVIASGAA